MNLLKKNWTIIFSVYALYDILPDEDMKYWRYFVLACYYLCNRVISEDHLIVAGNFLKKFCISFENLYVTINMHLHGHLVSCVRQYGPLYNFWLFNFERYNGILGNISNNKYNIKIQLMTHFDRDNQMMNLKYSAAGQAEMRGVFKKMLIMNSQRGTLSDMLAKDYVLYFSIASKNYNHKGKRLYNLQGFELPFKQKIYQLEEIEHHCLTSMYGKLYPEYCQQFVVSQVGWKVSELTFCGNFYSSKKSRRARSSYISAFWCGADGDIQEFERMYHLLCYGRVKYFLKHSPIVCNEETSMYWHFWNSTCQ